MGNPGRKYDREKWGWKDESELNNKSCHYSGLPSPSAYEDKHPYYNSKKKILQEEIAMKVIFISFVSLVVVIVLVSIFS
tara:strand:- start:235 stop:471 length:237 start_codon:yes stop_codon:yes gene_type:complete